VTDAPDPETEEERRTKVLRSHAAQLGEHFPSVLIVVTVHDPDNGTHLRSETEGNWFACYGSVKEWVTREEEKTRVAARPSGD
jgi:hypothetical protein